MPESSNGRRCPTRVSAQTKWQVFLQFTAGEISQAEAARKWRVDGSTVIGIRRTVKDAALAALARTVDRSHRKLAHRGSYAHQVRVSPSTFRRVLRSGWCGRRTGSGLGRHTFHPRSPGLLHDRGHGEPQVDRHPGQRGGDRHPGTGDLRARARGRGLLELLTDERLDLTRTTRADRFCSPSPTTGRR